MKKFLKKLNDKLLDGVYALGDALYKLSIVIMLIRGGRR